MKLGLLLLGLSWIAASAATTQPSFRVDAPHPTADKPQSKLWYSHEAWWALLPTAAGPTLWQRTATGWIEHPAIRRALAGLPGRADVWLDRDGVTAVTVAGTSLAVVRLRADQAEPSRWHAERLAAWTSESKDAIETVTLARDSSQRWWITAPVTSAPGSAERGVARKSGPPRDIEVWTSPDAVTWQKVAPAAVGVSGDDICAVTPFGRGVGVIWSDQSRDEIGFRLHSPDAHAPWSPTEIVAAGHATADDHLHAALGHDGTLWVATKNSVDQLHQPQLVLRSRSPTGSWRNLSYAPRLAGEEPSRPVVLATPRPDRVLLGHTVYARPDRHHGTIRFAWLSGGVPPTIGEFHSLIAPDPALRSVINDITTPKAPLPAVGPWIILASDAEGRVFEADLRSLPPPAEPPLPIVPPAAIRADPAGRSPVQRELEPLLLQQARFLVAELQPWPRDPRAKRLPLTKGAPSGENGIRPSAHLAKGLALMYRYFPAEVFPADFPRPRMRAEALAVLRYLLPTHGALGGSSDDGRPWGGQWQSAHWAALAGEACWLLWAELAPAERAQAVAMITAEAERFAAAIPPTARINDSKGEENAWNSQILSLASLMFPDHPRQSAWREAAIRWLASSFARPADLQRTDLVDGRPLRDWLAGANLHDDFTLENHRRVHPDYMACTYLLTSQVPMYAWGRQPEPAALHLNVAAINTALKRLALPDGAWLYPNGQDWGLRRNLDWFEYHTALAVLYGDPESAALQRACLATMQRMAARTPAGSLYRPEEIKLSSDQAMALELPAHAYALMAERGVGPAPVPLARLMADLSGRHVFTAGKFGVLRSAGAIATFSWGAQVMGQVMPLGLNQLLAPEARGLVGYVAVPDVAREAPVVRTVTVAPLPAALGVAGVLERAGGAVEQRFAFLALPDGRTVYADIVRLTGPTRPTLLDLGTLGVLNDRHWPVHPGRRTVAHAGGEQVFSAATAEHTPPWESTSRWFQLEDLGIVRLAATGPARYVPTPSGAAGRLEQRFHLNAVPGSVLASARPGAEVARCVLVFYPGRSLTETRSAADRCELRTTQEGRELTLQLEDGVTVRLDLARLHLETAPAPASTR